MTLNAAVAIASALLAVAPAVAARSHGGHPGRSTFRTHASHAASPARRSTGPRSSGAHATRGSGHRRALGAERDAHGKIRRDPAQRASFMRSHPCPSTGRTSGACPGYVVDHVQPLKRGGRDAPSNMQWQTVREAKAKDRSE